jgi:hypothetical protein
LEQGLYDRLWDLISEQLRAFVGVTAFEDLSRQWVLAQARADRLPFVPDRVGSHWGKGVQVDVTAVNWRERAILLGECKWGREAIGRSVVRELVDQKTSKVLRALPDGGAGWTVHYAFFARAGFTQAARQEAYELQALLVELATLDRGLGTGA